MLPRIGGDEDFGMGAHSGWGRGLCFGGDEKHSKIDSGNRRMTCEYTKSHRIVHIKWSIVYVAYINKTVYKKAFKGKYKPSFH